MEKIRIMTYNIQHGHVYLSQKPGDEIDLTKTGAVMRDLGADIIGVNEVRGNSSGAHPGYTAQAEELGAYLGYHAYFGRAIYVGGKCPYGNAVLSRWPIVEAKTIRIPDPVSPADSRHMEPRCIVRCVIEIPSDSPFSDCIAVYSTHFGLNPTEAEHAASTLIALLRDESLPFVVMGDFNLQPDSPLLAPLYKYLTPTDDLMAEDERFSFPSNAPRCKIDYIFTGNGAVPTAAKTEHIVASDHCPIWADIAW
ncbi:MAG: endonuclease/exonuclease/phosphatase family protein [Clostridia bacterium]|nr:endonuclease/exonuclease/phosphatase family protein [Clostridia bacterium]